METTETTETTGMSLDLDEEKIVLLSSDNTKREISRKYVPLSKFISTVLEADKDESVVKIPLNDYFLEKIIQFLKYHPGTPMPVLNRPVAEIEFPPWYAAFMNDIVSDNVSNIFDIVKAADFLNIQPLFELSCAKLALMIRNLSGEEIGALFNIDTSYTEEEKKEITRDTKWAEI